MADTGMGYRRDYRPHYSMLQSQRPQIGVEPSDSPSQAPTPFAERNREGSISGLGNKEIGSARYALLSRRSRSESIENEAAQAEEEQRAHSYAQGSGFHHR